MLNYWLENIILFELIVINQRQLSDLIVRKRLQDRRVIKCN